ncbi:invasion associated locus B family protein [Rhodovulum adriaticum]|uniref:Invasion protein IalB n=1 Tax=Rhodovulum adriaticum TaxID=35804 RepID=A0A4V2SMH7_RHOAD|nr:invasion associated locus B family protein [Rhodovulum adriaticum]TCP27326.1 invasion protein IalB [Rhodovulum adriaticum]
MTRHPIPALTLALGLAGALPGPATAQQDTAPDALRETFRDWTVQCETRKEQGRVCEMLQRVNHEESRSSILVFTLSFDAEGNAVSVMITPFGLRLPEGVTVVIEDTEIGTYPFETCLSNGCIVLARFDEKQLRKMRAGAEGEVRGITRTGESFAIPISLWGFSAALDRMRDLTGQ